MKIILMADIVGSSGRKGKALMANFKKVVEGVNEKNGTRILSPLTITLGDEFQGVVKNAQAALQIIFDMEKELMVLKSPFKLRYVIQEGEIQTPLNKKTAHEMLGPGLTDARERLTSLKTSKNRFQVTLENKDVAENLNLLFVIFQGITDQWTAAQQKVVATFLDLDDYRKVADKLKKDPTAIWRRRRSLMIEEFNSVKKLMLKMV